MSVSIHKRNVRDGLEPRREPYWAAPIEPGRYLGFRRIEGKAGSWIARARSKETGKQAYRALEAPADDFDAASAEARKWFEELDAGVQTKGVFTVADACREYVESLRRKERFKTADDAEWRFKRGAITADPAAPAREPETPLEKLRFGLIELNTLRTPTMEKWRALLGMTKAGQNRMMTSLRAALNLAVKNKRVSLAASQTWQGGKRGGIQQHPKADGRRRLYLDLKQRRALLKAAKGLELPNAGPARDLIEAAALTGARPGELKNALVSQFDARTKTMRFIGKTDSRDVPLSPAAATLFTRLAKGKEPTGHLFARDDGTPWPASEWTELVREAAKAAELPSDPNTGVCLYTLRHSFITATLLGGMPTLEVARLTGTSLQMIEENYGHLVANAARQRLAKVAML